MNKSEKLMKVVFFLSASFSILALLLIITFIFGGSIPFIQKYGVADFIFGTKWAPSDRPAQYGILPMIAGSFVVTIGAVGIGIPLGVLTAVYLAEYCPAWLYTFLQPAVQLMAAIPSIVYGFFAMQVLVPFVRHTAGGTGLSMLTAMIILGIMILPTVIGLSEASLRAVPRTYYEGSMALGSSHERSVFRVILPAAKSGILSSIVLGIGRAIGETMAVALVAGNQPLIPTSLTQGARTLTTNIVLEMAYASGEHQQALIATSAVLFLFILVIQACFLLIKFKETSE